MDFKHLLYLNVFSLFDDSCICCLWSTTYYLICVGIHRSDQNFGKSVKGIMIYNQTKNTYKHTVCPGYSQLLSPFTRTWSILSKKSFFAIKVDPLNLDSPNLRTFPWLSRVPHFRQIGPRVYELCSNIYTQKRQTNRNYSTFFKMMENRPTTPLLN